MKFNLKIFISVTLVILLYCQGCNSLDEERIPNMPVNISLSDIGMWNSFGVNGFGTYRMFTLNPRQPANFPYTAKSYTGFGGVLLIEGLDPFSGNSSMPMAYDMACPVERDPEVRIMIDNDSYMAICKTCGSVYDVTMQRGAPVSGPASFGKFKYALKSYNCIGNSTGGFVITN